MPTDLIAMVLSVRTLRWLSLLALCACVPAFSQSADVTLAYVSGQMDLQARFTLSQPTDVLRFAGNGELRKRTWRPEDGATLSEDGNELHLARAARWVSVRMLPRVRDGDIDRTYTPLLAFGDGRAVAVYSEYLLPKGGGVIRLANGGVVLGRAVARGEVAWRANDVATYLVVGDAKTIRGSDSAMTIDGAVPRWVADALARDVPALMQLYRGMFSDAPRMAPWLVVTFDPTTEGSSFRGDTNPGMVRLNLMGAGWSSEGSRGSRDLVAFVAHELMHLWNNGLWKEAQSAPIWLHEGGADAAAQDALHTLRRVTDAEYRDEQVASIMRCAQARGDTIADKVKTGGRVDYACGASLFYLSASVLSQRPDRLGPLGIWKAMFEATRSSRVYGVADLKRAVSRDGGSPIDDLIDSKSAWNEVLRDRAKGLHVHVPGNDEQPPSALAAVLIDSLVIDLVRRDCKGGISVYSDQQVYGIEALPACATIKSNLSARSLGGYSMRDEPGRALAYASERCSQGLALHLAGDDGRTLDLPCAQPIVVPPGIVVPDTVF
jgi:hypothetical protein